ncbi:MAG: 4-hydroxy-3-methylbut-2-enyl diphosphate reductase [Candidatus Omnitrophica bacterium]|nr:4-hydroxy-3-methylbut-2-enyl diphosphate reductase [Candidatus Omnitrophota bacterium]
MRINLAKSAGFCFGVKRALKIAVNTAKTEKNVCMLGDIVHNEEVVKLITKSGIQKITLLSCGKSKTLLIRAHGACRKTFAKAKKLGYRIVDATCPMVKEIHKIVMEKEKLGFQIIILNSLHKIKKACVVAQSTQNFDKVKKVLKIIKAKIKNVKFFNTICRPTIIKQEEIKKMPLGNDVMIIIGSKNSANSKRLYEISRNLNKNSYWIGSENEIKKEWFNNAKSVGITAGASTPEPAIQAIINHIRNYSSKD